MTSGGTEPPHYTRIASDSSFCTLSYIWCTAPKLQSARHHARLRQRHPIIVADDHRSRSANCRPAMLARQGEARAAARRPLQYGVRRRRRDRAFCGALRRRYSRPPRLPRSRAGSQRRRACGGPVARIGLCGAGRHGPSHIEGRTLVEADLRANIARIVALLATCHRDLARHLAGPANMFWVFHVIRDYARTLRAADATATASIALRGDGRCARGPADAAADRLRPPRPAPRQFFDDGKRLWLIDWEYGGFGTAMFDLANLAANGKFSPADDLQLLEAYFRQPASDDVHARSTR